jgi:biphenyl-2,3-diol 1,2-dioxygenase
MNYKTSNHKEIKMNAITELGYLGLEVSKLWAWDAFAADALGMSVSEGALPNTRWLQMDEQRCRVILTEGPADDHAFAGWRVQDHAAVEAFGRQLTEKGVAWSWANDNELALRAVKTMLHFQDPTGTRHEVFAQPLSAAARVIPSRFVTGEGGMGHAVYLSTDYPATLRFAKDVLGFRLTDTVEAKVGTAQDIHMEASFLHTNQRHHSFAVAQQPSTMPGHKRLHHFMAEVESVEEVGVARDRCLALGLTVVQDIGQHRNDKMISFYVQSPSGFFVEFGWGGRKVDTENWQVRTYDKFSEWGHRPAQGYDFVGKKQ